MTLQELEQYLVKAQNETFQSKIISAIFAVYQELKQLEAKIQLMNINTQEVNQEKKDE